LSSPAFLADPRETEGHILKGLPASSGFCMGEIVIEAKQARPVRQKLAPPDEEAALDAAIGAALASLSHLITHADEEAGAMLAFQMAMLEDDALTSPARDAIRRGEAADLSFRHALDRNCRL
jgi:phosphoenolpyruvate-protein phosphotransferase (PTS system enzyme I)